MGMEIAAPLGDLGMKRGDAVDDRHEKLLARCSYGASLSSICCDASKSDSGQPVNRQPP